MLWSRGSHSKKVRKQTLKCKLLNAGLTKQEAALRVLSECGFSFRDMAEFFRQDKNTVMKYIHIGYEKLPKPNSDKNTNKWKGGEEDEREQENSR